MVWLSLAPKWPILVHFGGIDHQKSKFLLILAPFLSEAVEDSWCYFFGNWFVKLKFPNLLKPVGTIIQQNYWSLYPSELIYFALFTMRHPVLCSVPSCSVQINFGWPKNILSYNINFCIVSKSESESTFASENIEFSQSRCKSVLK